MGRVGNGEHAILGVGGHSSFAPSVLGEEEVNESGGEKSIVLFVILVVRQFIYLFEGLTEAGEEDWRRRLSKR